MSKNNIISALSHPFPSLTGGARGGSILVLILLLFASCSDEPGTGMEATRELRLVMGTQGTTDVTDITRALPANYRTYSEHYGASMPSDAQIQGFLTTASGSEPIQAIFPFIDNEGRRSWTSHMKIDNPGADYYLYGFMPREAASDFSILPYNSSYSNGAQLTISGLNVVSGDDPCVIVGVKGYAPANATDPLPAITDDVLAMNTRLGQFGLRVDQDVNYAYLLVNHLYSNLNFSMKIEARYSELRTIKVKKMELKASSISSDKIDMALTLAANTSATDPLTINNTTDTGSATTASAQFFPNSDVTEVTLSPTTASVFRSYFAPGKCNEFTLVTTYDVYDRKNNLIRENETAENTFRLNALKTEFTSNPLKAGEAFTINIEVQPTYLYVLSDPDLNDPTFKFN